MNKMDNSCDKCKNQVVLHAFSNGNCERCNKEIVTSHTPCNKLCEKCSLLYNRCQSCGENLKE